MILPPQIKSIQELLGGDVTFAVPKYQRSFAWGLDEITEFWEDILDAIKAKKPDYFLGTVVLEKKGEKLESYEIIDGQQRLICIAMIASAIRNAYKSRDEATAWRIFFDFLGSKGYSQASLPKPKLKLNRVNNPVYEKYVIDSVDHDVILTALQNRKMDNSNRDLLEAYKFFLTKIGEEAGLKGTQYENFLVPLIECLKSSIKLITITVTNEEDAYLIFESVNARGVELTVSDLVKNRLYSEADEKVEQAQQLWEQMESDLLRSSIPEFLRHYWIAKKADEKNLKVRKKELYRAIKKAVKGESSTIHLLKDLVSSAGNYARIEDYSLWPDDAYDESFKGILDELNLFGVSQCYPVLLNAIESFKSPTEIVNTFRFIANFSFRYNIVGNGTSGSLENIFGKIAYGIRVGSHTSPRDIADELRAVNSDRNFRADFELKTIPKAKGKLARYILTKINNQMGTGEQIPDPNPKKVNLEHILPQNPEASWRSAFTKGIDYSEYIYRIGNLTLLTKKVNGAVANKSFTDKQKLAFSQSGLPLNKYLNQAAKWSNAEIEERQKEMAKLALQVWKL